MDIGDSIEAIMSDKRSMCAAFYDRFLQEHPEARPYFAAVDMGKQASFLTVALAVIEDYCEHGYEPTEHYLRVLGTRHRNWGIPTELFGPFRDCLLETMAEFHQEDWNDELEEQWRQAIDAAIELMLEGYRQQGKP